MGRPACGDPAWRGVPGHRRGTAVRLADRRLRGRHVHGGLTHVGPPDQRQPDGAARRGTYRRRCGPCCRRDPLRRAGAVAPDRGGAGDRHRDRRSDDRHVARGTARPGRPACPAWRVRGGSRPRVHQRPGAPGHLPYRGGAGTGTGTRPDQDGGTGHVARRVRRRAARWRFAGRGGCDTVTHPGRAAGCGDDLRDGRRGAGGPWLDEPLGSRPVQPPRPERRRLGPGRHRQGPGPGRQGQGPGPGRQGKGQGHCRPERRRHGSGRPERVVPRDQATVSTVRSSPYGGTRGTGHRRPARSPRWTPGNRTSARTPGRGRSGRRSP